MQHPEKPFALFFVVVLLLGWVDRGVSSESQPLTLDEAVATALTTEDPEFARFTARAEALENRAVADSQLPDPKITGQVANVPVDSFEFDQEGMTQALRLGLRQEFPAGKTLKVRGEQRRAEAEAERARREAARARRCRCRGSWGRACAHP